MTLVVFPCELVSFSLFPLDRISEMQRKKIINSPFECEILHQFNDNNVLKPTILQ